MVQWLGFDAGSADFADGYVHVDGQRKPLADAAQAGDIAAEDAMKYGTRSKQYAQDAFGAHFVEVGMHAATGEIRIHRMLAVCAAGRILNPKAARSQITGGTTMGAGAALMKEMVVDKMARLLRQSRPRWIRGAGSHGHPSSVYRVPGRT